MQTFLYLYSYTLPFVSKGASRIPFTATWGFIHSVCWLSLSGKVRVLRVMTLVVHGALLIHRPLVCSLAIRQKEERE